MYENIRNFKLIINDLVNLKKLEKQVNLLKIEKTGDFDQYIKDMKEVEKNLDKIAGVELIKEKITKSRRILKKDNPDLNKILSLLMEAKNMYNSEIKWRNRAKLELLPQLEEFDTSINDTIGLRLQERLTIEQAKFVSSCRSVHRDISLNF